MTASKEASLQEMVSLMSNTSIKNDVHKLLGIGGQNLKTWGDVSTYMQEKAEKMDSNIVLEVKKKLREEFMIVAQDIDNNDLASFGSLADSEGVDHVEGLKWNEKKAQKEAGGSEVQGPPGPGSALAIHGTVPPCTCSDPPHRDYPPLTTVFIPLSRILGANSELSFIDIPRLPYDPSERPSKEEVQRIGGQSLGDQRMLPLDHGSINTTRPSLPSLLVHHG